jgi:hypothetical protein
MFVVDTVTVAAAVVASGVTARANSELPNTVKGSPQPYKQQQAQQLLLVRANESTEEQTTKRDYFFK